MKKYSVYVLMILLPFAACEGNSMEESEWLIPRNMVFDGGPGKDGIPALLNPEFIPASAVNFLEDDDLVIGLAHGEDARAYPHPILDWHEIINDDLGDKSLAIIYCPLTGTGIAWNRMLKGQKTTFGVSGLLYNSNVIPYDRSTNSNWSQLLLKSVNGQLTGVESENYSVLETTWGTWKNMYPGSQVMSLSTGHSRNYSSYPYGNYKQNNVLFFPVTNTDSRLHSKERVLAVILNGSAKAYRQGSFSEGISMVYDTFNGQDLVIVGSEGMNFLVAFHRTLNGTTLDFQVLENELPALLIDNEGTKWDPFGRGISGPRQGQLLLKADQMMGYWFSFAAFYPGLRIFGQ